MSAPLRYLVRVSWQYLGSVKVLSDRYTIPARDEWEAQSMARLAWMDTHPGEGVRYLGSCAEAQEATESAT